MRTADEAGLSHDDAVPPNGDDMRDMHEVVDLGADLQQDLDSDRSSLYGVLSGDRAVGVPIVVECQAAFAALRKATKFRWLFQSFGYAYTSASCRTFSGDDDPGHHELIS